MLVTTAREDDGFTVVELAVVMGIAMVVMGSLLGLLVSQSNATVRLERFAGNQEQTRLAMVALQKDLRSSETLLEVPAGADVRYRVDLLRYVDASAAEPDTISWQLGADGELVRYHVLTDGDPAVTHRLGGVANLQLGVPLFTYFRANGSPYPATESRRTLADCSVKLGLELRAAPEAGPAPSPLSSAVQLRNRITAGHQC